MYFFVVVAGGDGGSFFNHLLSIYSLMRLKNKMCHLPSVPHTQTILEDEVDDPVYQVGP